MPPPYTHPLDDPLTVHLQPPIPVEKHDNAALMKDAVERTELRRSLAALAGMDDMTTMADFIQALQNIGLLFELPGAHRVLVPNAVPRMVWDFADLSEGNVPRADCRSATPITAMSPTTSRTFSSGRPTITSQQHPVNWHPLSYRPT